MPGPTSTDANFERTFADLAYARLRDKAPSMLDHLVGFQMLDKNEDETHAVGVFGFKVGPEWVYAPVFFINGELKGHELMYIKGQDAFVPLTEEWVNYVLNRRPSVLGEAETTPRNDLPLRQPDFDVFARSPYIGSKSASAAHIGNDFHAFLPVFDTSNWPTAKKYAALSKRFSLPYALKALGPRAQATLASSMRGDHKFANAVLKFYDIKDLVNFEKSAEKLAKDEAGYQSQASFNFCKECKHFSGVRSCDLVTGDISPNGTCNYYATSAAKVVEPIKPGDEIKTGSEKGDSDKGPHQDPRNKGDKGKTPRNTTSVDEVLTQEEQDEHGREEGLLNELSPAIPFKHSEPKVAFITRENSSAYSPYLNDADRSDLLVRRYLVKDARHDDAVSKVYKTQVRHSVQGPRDSGVYDVLTSDGSTQRMLVLATPLIFDQYQRHELAGTVTVMDLESKAYGNYFPIDVLTAQMHGSDALEKVVASGKNPAELRPHSVSVLIGPEGKGTTPFEVSDKLSSNAGQTEFKVWGRASLSDNASSLGRKRRYSSAVGERDDFSSSIRSIVITGRPGRLRQVGETLYVPDGYKAIELEAPPPAPGQGEVQPCCPSTRSLELGNINDFWQQLHIKAAQAKDSLRHLRLHTDGIGIRPELSGRQGPVLSKVAAVGYLVTRLGLRQGKAEELLKEAKPGKAPRYLLKLAQGYEIGHGDVPYPAYFPEPVLGTEGGISAPIQYPQQELQNIGQINPSNREFYQEHNYIDEGAKRQAQSAADAGQKEVLDTSVITGLVKTLDSSDTVDSYISDLLLGLDRLGRILFMFYWHNDQFKDRYGQQDLPELEDNLRNVFKNLGELSLFLKQKTVEPEIYDSSEAELTDVLA